MAPSLPGISPFPGEAAASFQEGLKVRQWYGISSRHGKSQTDRSIGVNACSVQACFSFSLEEKVMAQSLGRQLPPEGGGSGSRSSSVCAGSKAKMLAGSH